MDLPNYSLQLLQQLHTLCREQQFCDCSIMVGTMHFRAHKVVLAAASLLFRSVLDGTDTLSIDASVVTPEDFALLLEMIYTGKLPAGKHNFTNIISAADSLQMFDVAVSCKTLLRDLLSCSSQRQVSAQTVDASSKNSVAVSEGAHAAQLNAKAVMRSVYVSPADPTREQGQSMCPASASKEALDKEVQLPDSPTQDSEALPCIYPDRQTVCEEGEHAKLLEERALERGTDTENKAVNPDFLLQHKVPFSEVLSNTQAVLQQLEECKAAEPAQKEVLIACLQGEEGVSAFQRLLSRVQEGQQLCTQDAVPLFGLLADMHPKTAAVLSAGERERLDTGISGEVASTAALLQERREELVQAVTHLRPIQELLNTGRVGFLSGTEKQAILDCCEGSSPREAVENMLKKALEEKTLSTESLVKLLGALKAPFPGLGLLLDNWVAAAVGSDGTARWNLEACGKGLLRRHQDTLARYVVDAQLWQRTLPSLQHLAPGSREAMEQIVTGAAESGVLGALASAALEERTLPVAAVWQVLLALQETELPLKRILAEIQKEPEAALFFQTVGSSDGIATEILLRHRTLITEALRLGAGLQELPPGEADLAEAVQELLSTYLPEEPPVTSRKAALSSALDKPLPAVQIFQLLCSIQESFPGLRTVMQELQQAGLLMEGEGAKAGVWKWKVNSLSQVEAVGKAEQQKANLSRETPEGSASKKSLVCKACRKSFHYYCRLKVHEKRCRVANQKLVQCKECNEMRTSKMELEKHQRETHGKPGSATSHKRQKKRRLPVACDICGREFAHTSGMQYHKLTEHFDEKPFACEECGAKFAANSTLKNHRRLHTGDQPFVCKHCLMAFSQASALAYHTKKKHATGKMYACQYCAAVFAQSIELSRHVRTHTGDKPYVCRECGKGFRQANGLSIHLCSSHNIDNPHDCKKCQMSFPTLQEHQRHIYAAHTKEAHACPTCGKVFSAPSLLERHLVTHVGGKPFRCQICDKAYQQLSGLWYHNRTHHPDVFAAQNHRSSKFSSLQCGSCDKTFSSTAAHRRHIKEEHADVTFHECEKCQGLFPTPALLQAHVKCQHDGPQMLPCPHCSASFQLQGPLQHHMATEHPTQAEPSSPSRGLRGELSSGQEQLEGHYGAEHPKVVPAHSHSPTARIVQVTQMPQ